MARGDTVLQAVDPPRKILTYIENHWEAPNNRVGQSGEMLGRLTDEAGRPLTQRAVALHLVEPDGVAYDVHGIITDMNGVMRHTVNFTKAGFWEAYYWFGGDATYEGCEEEAAPWQGVYQ